MRLIHEDSSPLRIGMVMFLISFTVLGVAFLAMWMGLAVLGMDPPHGLWVLVAAVLGGAYTATRCTQVELSERQRRKEAAFTLPGEHPRLGAYRYWPHHPHWEATVTLIPGTDPSVDLGGSGLAPSDEDVALWLDRIAPQMDELIKAAGIRMESEGQVEGIGTKIKLTPKQVEFREGSEIEILFTPEPYPDSDTAEVPCATFSRDLELLDADWSM